MVEEKEEPKVSVSNSESNIQEPAQEKPIVADETTPPKSASSNKKAETPKKDHSTPGTSTTPVKSPQKNKTQTPKQMSEVSVVIEKLDSSIESVKGVIVKPPHSKKRNRKRKSKRASDAPKFPLNGYVRFVNERREIVKNENPQLNHIEITKRLADEWFKLTEDKKQPYMEEAEKDRERYLLEMKEYNKVQSAKKAKTEENQSVSHIPVKALEPKETSTPLVNGTNVKPPLDGDRDIQIFTEDFLEYNKQVESELKILRKSNTDYEQQNSNLERYVENMKSGVEGLNETHTGLQSKNEALEKYLRGLKTVLANALQGITLPDNKGATFDNIETYMHELSTISGPASTLNKAKDIIRKLDFHSINV